MFDRGVSEVVPIDLHSLLMTHTDSHPVRGVLHYLKRHLLDFVFVLRKGRVEQGEMVV